MKLIIEVEGVNPCDDFQKLIRELIDSHSLGRLIDCCECDDDPLKERIRELHEEVSDAWYECEKAESEASPA